jgi:hypothetical protein
LFSTFLAVRNRTRTRGALVFSVDIAIRVPEYEIDRLLFDHHIEGSYLYRDSIHIAAEPPAEEDGQWRVRYGYDSRTPGRPGSTDAEVMGRDDGSLVFGIPVKSSTRPGIDAMLEITAVPWNK